MTSIVDVPAHPSGDSAPVTGSEDEGEIPANDPGASGHPDSNLEYESGNEESSSRSDSGSGSDSPGSDNDDEFGDMFSPGGTLQPIERKPESRAQSNSRTQSQESEPHKQTLTPSPENEPNLDKPEQKKKKSSSGKSGTPKGVPTPNPEAIDKMAQDIGEELIQDLQEKDNQDCRSRSKKTKKDSDREAEKVAREKEEEERKWQKKKKREKEAKERKEKEEQEAKKWAEEEQLASDKRSAWAKLIHTAQLEKYDKELPELKRYRKKFISNIQRTTINLDSHIRYLELVMEDKSLYPNRNVILATRRIQKLRNKKRDNLADWFLAVIDKGFGSHSPQGFLQPDDPVMKPLYFVRCLMRSDGTVIDATDKNYGDDQNISLHDLASLPSMQRLATSRKITVNSRRLLTSIDTRFCPFASCHKTLNNHVRIHLSLSLFCGFLGCFYASSYCKAMFQHAIMQHLEYEKSKELYPKDG